MSRRPCQIFNSAQLATLRGLKFGGINVCSYIPKSNDIVTLLNNSNLDYLGITESWLNSSISDCELEIDGYSLLRNDRDNGSSKRGGGGILIYSRTNHVFQHLPGWNLCCDDIEWAWTKLQLPDTRPTFLCTLYRPPSGNYHNFEELLENKILDLYTDFIPDIILIGDINIDVSERGSLHKKEYLKLLKTMGLEQLIHEPTRVTDKTASIIDHIVTNRCELYVHGGVLSLGISDHRLVYTNRKKCKISRSFQYIACRSYTNMVDADFQRDVANLEWSDVFTCNNLDHAVTMFQDKFMEIVEKHAPLTQL